MSTEILKLALEVLENNRQAHHYCEDTWYSCPKHEDGCANDAEGDECNCGADKANAEIDAAITAIKEALAHTEQPNVRTGNCLRVGVCASEGHKIAPQRTWVGLTDEEIGAILEDVNAYGTRLYTFARAIEAAHGIKGKA